MALCLLQNRSGTLVLMFGASGTNGVLGDNYVVLLLDPHTDVSDQSIMTKSARLCSKREAAFNGRTA
jgi:hypothetical protein